MVIAMTKIDSATRRLFHDPAKRRAWVIYQLSLQGESLASLARAHGLDRTAPGQALAKPWPRMERILARAVGVPVQELFPDRWHPDGTRLIRIGRPVAGEKSIRKTKDNTRRQRRNVDDEAAA